MDLNRKITDFIRLEQAAGSSAKLVQIGAMVATTILVTTLASSVAEAGCTHVNVTGHDQWVDVIPIYCGGNLCGFEEAHTDVSTHDDYAACVPDPCVEPPCENPE